MVQSGAVNSVVLDVLLTIFLSDERVQRPFAGKMASCGACALCALSFHFISVGHAEVILVILVTLSLIFEGMM